MMDDYLRKLNTMTKYPSIATFHAMGERGRLTEEHRPPEGPVIVTEKVDGTNGRIIFTQDGWFIGSREELLTYKTDEVRNPALGIVDALMATAMRASRAFPPLGVSVAYFEVYGGKIGAAAKAYTSTGATGTRVFDMQHIARDALDSLLALSVEEIAAWRDNGGQHFLTEGGLEALAEDIGVPLTPRLGGNGEAPWPPPGQPVSVASAADWLEWRIGKTGCALDGTPGNAEGVVIRTEDRSYIRKLRFEDYRRTLRSAR